MGAPFRLKAPFINVRKNIKRMRREERKKGRQSLPVALLAELGSARLAVNRIRGSTAT